MSFPQNIGSVVSAAGNHLQAVAFKIDHGNRLPAWFKLWMEAKTGELYLFREPFAKFSINDHGGRIGPYVTFEPYDTAMRAADWRNLLNYCEQIGLEVQILAASSWYPTRTILVVMWPKGKPELFGKETWDGKLTSEETQKLKSEAKAWRTRVEAPATAEK